MIHFNNIKQHGLQLLRKLRVPMLTALIALGALVTMSAAPSPDAGKAVFKNYCASCHNKNMKSKSTGPALGNVEADWADYPREELYAWIRNSQKLIKAGHPRATQLWNEYKPTVMTAFPDLTDDDIENVLSYIDGVAKGTYGAPKGGAVAAADAASAPTQKKSNNWIYYILFAVLAALAVILANVISSLSRIQAAKSGDKFVGKTVLQQLTSKGVIMFLIFALIVIGGYFTANKAMSLGRQQGYQPEQPIKFSHETHAGVHKIDCQYCHDGARRSKHSVIPAANTCMNCHAAINYGSKHGTAEISKIYASIGYNPAENKYIENYDEMSQEDIAKIFKKWIGDKYIENNDLTALDRKGEKVVKNQWEGIVKSLTNDQKKQIQGPIEWIRIHNLPDHVYFNHSQHVTVGKVECQQCHGPVETMEVVEQEAPLSMGWCINCHRQTEVKFADNEYYKSYEKFHKEIKEGKRDKVTVSDIGGLECQKCHY